MPDSELMSAHVPDSSRFTHPTPILPPVWLADCPHGPADTGLISVRSPLERYRDGWGLDFDPNAELADGPAGVWKEGRLERQLDREGRWRGRNAAGLPAPRPDDGVDTRRAVLQEDPSFFI